MVFSPGILKAQTLDFGNLIVDTSKGKQGIITFHNIGVKSSKGDDLGKFWAEFTWNLPTASWVFNGKAGEERKGVIIGGDSNFDNTARIEEAYWYSRYNLGELVMTSGLGVTFMPDMERVMQAVTAVDSNPNDGDKVALPKNPALLKAVYKSGNPAFVNPNNGDPDDFINFRWDENSFNKTVTEEAQGWTMIKEIEWAKLFHVEAHFGFPSSPFGSNQRFAGMVLAMEAQMQAMEWINWSKGVKGVVQFESSKLGKYVMLFLARQSRGMI